MGVRSELIFLFYVSFVTGGSQLSNDSKSLIRTSTVSIPKELESVNLQTSGQLLELIVKIAEQPDTWKQIHRVLETLEANNAAYSNRVTLTKHKQEHQTVHPKVTMTKHFGDKRNDVPEKMSETFIRSAETYQQWKDSLFADESLHPQLKIVEDIEKASNTPPEVFHLPVYEKGHSISPTPLPGYLQFTSGPDKESERSFDDRLKEIEKELRKLAKLARLMPKKQNNSKIGLISEQKQNSSSQALIDKTARANYSKTAKTSHKFLYHRVGNVSDDRKPTEANIWKAVALAKNNGGNTRRKTFVAVSLFPNTNELMHKPSLENLRDFSKTSSSVDTSSTRKMKDCRKKSSSFPKLRKQKQEKSTPKAVVQTSESKE